LSDARALSPSARRVQDALDAAGLDCRVVEHEASARTSAEAASLLGCEVAQIAKSLVFRRGGDGAVLVIASGANRVDEAKVAALLREPIGRADAAFVREATGYAIGGVPPLGHERELETIVDESLRRFPTVWAAAGTPHAVFEVETDALIAALPESTTISAV
jgi:prolyl-tRNA editing enzyme YbaK/EbsC (Cys-tRNA(Pro) deacylase)